MMFGRRFGGASIMCAVACISGAASAFAGGEVYTGSGGLDLQVGGVVVVTPKFEGSKEYEVRGFPILAPAGNGEDGTIQFKGPDDVRLRLFQASGFEAGPLAGYRFSREDDDADRLRGLGDVDGGLVLGAYAAYRTGPLAAFVSYNHQVTGDDSGGLLRFGLEGTASLSPSLKTTAVIGATYADDDYMDAYFGVTQAQSIASGLARFDADSGIKDVYFGLSADLALSELWTLKMMGRYSHLVGDAADSPIVETESQFFGGLGLTYKFTWTR